MRTLRPEVKQPAPGHTADGLAGGLDLGKASGRTRSGQSQYVKLGPQACPGENPSAEVQSPFLAQGPPDFH